MGNQQSTGGLRVSRFSSTDNPKNRLVREHKRHGVVSLKINSSNSGRRLGEGQISHVITPKGAILYGSLFNPAPIQRAMSTASLPILIPGDISIPDSRANKLLVTYCYGWHLIPFPEVFSRHSGTCYVVGDRNVNGPPVEIKVGDCFRLGSVGLVVSEVKITDEDEQKIDAKTLQFLKDEALAFDTNEDLAALASDEMMGNAGEKEGGMFDNSLHQSFDDDQTNRGSLDEGNAPSPTPFSPGTGLTNGEKFICYMCYETHNTTEDPLIAPCDCKGDTRFLHVHCLQKWYHTSAYGSHAQVVRTTGNGAPACKICGTAYKTNFKRADGKKASILELENDGPYLSLVVVTHHDTNPGLFNTKFRLNFGRRSGTPPHVTDAELNTVVIGRSSSCAMILDYRTVSTIHAKITHQNGKFFLSDNRSSNGTMVYIREPLSLPYSQPVKIRMGRTTLSLQAKRSWTAAMRSFVFGTNPNDEVNDFALASQHGLPGPVDVMNLLATIHNMPPEKSSTTNPEVEGNENNNPPAFLNHRSYTIRTINEGSVDGGDDERLTAINRYSDFPFGPDRLLAEIVEARQQHQDMIRRLSEQNAIENQHHYTASNNNYNSPGSLSPISSQPVIDGGEGSHSPANNNVHNRIFLNNNSNHGSQRGHSPINNHGVSSASESDRVMNQSNSQQQLRSQKEEENNSNSHGIFNNQQDLTLDSVAYSHVENSSASQRKSSLTNPSRKADAPSTLIDRNSRMLTKDLTEPILKEQDLRDETEDYVPHNVNLSLSPSRERNNAGSTIVVGNHVEGSDMFQSITANGEGGRPLSANSGGVNNSGKGTTGGIEGTPAELLPAASVFAIPASHHSSSFHRRGNSHPTTPIMTDPQVEPVEEKAQD